MNGEKNECVVVPAYNIFKSETDAGHDAIALWPQQALFGRSGKASWTWLIVHRNESWVCKIIQTLKAPRSGGIAPICRDFAAVIKADIYTALWQSPRSRWRSALKELVAVCSSTY